MSENENNKTHFEVAKGIFRCLEDGNLTYGEGLSVLTRCHSALIDVILSENSLSTCKDAEVNSIIKKIDIYYN